MSKSTKTSSSSVMTPTNPEWSTSTNQGISQGVAGLSQLDPQSLVSPSNGLIDQAATSAAGLGSQDGAIRSILSQGAPTMQAESLLKDLNSYQNPYDQMVRQSALQGFDENAGTTRAQQSLDTSRNQAWGGSGSAIAQMLTERGLSQDRSALDSGLLSQGFNTAAGLSADDANRRQSAGANNLSAASTNQAQQLQGLLALGDQQRANVGAQLGAGDVQRQIDTQQRQAPISLLQQQAGINSQIPYSLFNGQNTTGTSTSKTSDPLGTLGSLALGAGSLFAAPLTGGLSLGGLGGLFGSASAGLGAMKAFGGSAMA